MNSISTAKFYLFFGVIFALLSVFNHVVYLRSYAPDWDANTVMYTRLLTGVAQNGHFTYEGGVLTWFFAAFAVPCLVTVAVKVFEPQLQWCVSRLYAWAEFNQYRSIWCLIEQESEVLLWSPPTNFMNYFMVIVARENYWN